jgi:hypothetical protein
MLHALSAAEPLIAQGLTLVFPVANTRTMAGHVSGQRGNLESSGDEFRQSLQAISADPLRTREYLLRVSMIASLHRAEELG